MANAQELREKIEKQPEWLELETELAEITETDFRLETYFLETLKGINFQQMLMLFREGDKIEPKTILEIGSRAGCSSGIFGALAKKHDGMVYCIDPNHHSLWWFNMQKYHLQNYCTPIRAASPWLAWDKPIEMLHIDGDHDFLPCLMDFYFFYRFVVPGGLITFHDTSIRDSVKKAVALIESLYNLERVAIVEHGSGAIMFRKL